MKLAQRLILLVIAVCEGCGRGAPPAAAPAVPGRAAANALQTQVAASTPCAWLPPTEVEKIVGGALAQPPQRVLSAENPRPADIGEACLYEFPDTGAGKNTIVVQLIPDESGAMQTAFQGMGNVEKEFRNAPRTADAPMAVLNDAFGFGGHNVALAFTEYVAPSPTSLTAAEA